MAKAIRCWDTCPHLADGEEHGYHSYHLWYQGSDQRLERMIEQMELLANNRVNSQEVFTRGLETTQAKGVALG